MKGLIGVRLAYCLCASHSEAQAHAKRNAHNLIYHQTLPILVYGAIANRLEW